MKQTWIIALTILSITSAIAGGRPKDWEDVNPFSKCISYPIGVVPTKKVVTVVEPFTSDFGTPVNDCPEEAVVIVDVNLNKKKVDLKDKRLTSVSRLFQLGYAFTSPDGQKSCAYVSFIPKSGISIDKETGASTKLATKLSGIGMECLLQGAPTIVEQGEPAPSISPSKPKESKKAKK